MIYGTPEFRQLLFDMIQRKKRHPLYEESVDEYCEMKPHIYGDKPLDLLNKTRPREPQEVKDYRLDNYEPTTKATASKALSVVQKIFNPWFYEIKWDKSTVNGDKLKDYALSYYPKYNSVVKFMSESGLKRMIADPNGLMAIRINAVPQNELQMTEPIIVMYGSTANWWVDADCYVFFQKQEQTENGTLYTFTYYDKNFIVDFTAIIYSTDQVVTDEILIYETGFNEFPVWSLQGDPETTDEGLEYYCSFFEPAKPWWNLAIRHESDVYASYINHMFPQKVEMVEDCDYIDGEYRCDLGKIRNADGKLKTCPSCKGTGKKTSTGPYGVHYVTRDKLKDGTGGMEPVQYLTIQVEPTKMLEERAALMHTKGLESLNMDVIQKVGENQSGVAKVIDRGELYDFLSKISSVVYDTHLTNIFYFFNKFMFGVQDSNPNRKLDDNLPEISKPVKFDISTTNDMINQYSVAKTAGADPEYLRQLQMSIAAKEFSNTPDLQKEILLSIELDPLPGLNVVDAEALLATGAISKRDMILHFNMSKFMHNAIAEDETFYALPYQEKMQTLYAMVDQFIALNKVTLDLTNVQPSERIQM